LAWLGEHLAEWQRVLKPNGSLYVFASPRMAARVEVEVGKRFNVLNHIVWAKPESRAQRADKEALRAYFGASERIIFAELRGFVFEPLRAYLASEWARAGLGSADANIATGSFMANHYLTRSQWALPTRDKYEQLREYANTHNHGGEYLRREYEELRREYEELQREYEELRREYEELRRPFTVSADVPYTDVWTFPTVRGYAGKHPCEKPLAMIEHIVKASSRAGDTIFDPFMGSGTSALAAQRLGREFVGCDIEQGWVNAAQARMAQMQMQSALL
jgi:site-specific DNA-methyltransferase (adenine-specific)